LCVVTREREREKRQKKAQLAQEQKAKVIEARNSPRLVNLFSYGVDADCSTMCQDGKRRKIPDLFLNDVKTVIWRGSVWRMEMRDPQYLIDLLGRSGRLQAVLHQI